jgi:hypothetical protein
MTRKRGRHASPAKSAGPATLGVPTARPLTPGPVAAGPVTAQVTTGGAAKSTAMRSTVPDVTLPDIGSVAAFVQDEPVVRRTKYGWRVGNEDLPDLTSAMILADLLAAENGTAQAPPPKPSQPSQPSQPNLAGDAGRLRATVSQLEHALATRIKVEQAIGVLAERHRIKPRQAFEQLREAARSRGRKVFDIAGDVVASATNPLLQLPDELSRPRSAPRRGVRPQPGAQPSGAQY